MEESSIFGVKSAERSIEIRGKLSRDSHGSHILWGFKSYMGFKGNDTEPTACMKKQNQVFYLQHGADKNEHDLNLTFNSSAAETFGLHNDQ